MQRPVPIRALTRITLGTVLCALLSSHLLAQQTPPRQPASALPVTAPTTPIVAAPPAAAMASPAAPAHRADVAYLSGQLSVIANNSSLNQILREISRQTGMKITGGVADERVYGTYGPAAPAQVLAILLEGTSSNILLVQGTNPNPLQPTKVPVELVLTPRHGGPTPPNPSASGSNDTAESSDPAAGESSNSSRNPPPLPASNIPDPNGAAGAPPASGDAPATDDKSSTGARTPQQIYEQLLRMRQQSTTPAAAPQQ
ncbi:hypothetical protein [Granulicella sp. dw_53]|uniref:hypothetical protein n=1 Tax=Granulicella sp. dw_53 TaxID=2719792 RepID=UPI001BD58D27|nr:hypothetical protein [Granulicella sp. dw_53]